MSSQVNQPRPGSDKTVQTTECTVEQLYRTLLLSLRYAKDGDDIFNRVFIGLEMIHFLPMLDRMGAAELRRLIPMMSLKLRSLRLQVSDIPKLQSICEEMDVSHLVNTRGCVLMDEKKSRNTSAKHIELLSELLPNLEILRVSCSGQGHFPVLEKVRILHLDNVSQSTLEDLIQKCPQVKHFELSDKNDSSSLYDIKNIGLCKLIKVLMLPLRVTTPLAICHLVNLSHLSLQCKRLWPESDWVPSVLAIVEAKRFALERLTIDGTWLVGPLIVSKLQLTQCTALKELRFSNCKVIDGVGSPLPLSCQQLSFRRCTLNTIHGFLATQQMLNHIELLECRVQWSGPLLKDVLALSKRRLGPVPLVFLFSQSTRLRSEYTKFEKEELEASKPWFQVSEVEPPQSETWKQPLGMISMKFGSEIDHLPDLQHPLESIPVAADLLKEFE